MTKIPSHTPNSAVLSDNLVSQLRQILRIAEEGDWQRIEELAPAVIATLEAFRATPLRQKDAPVDLGLIQEIQNLLQVAISSCSTRMEQIAPLVNALKVTRASTDNP